jgi:hypothetical protein
MILMVFESITYHFNGLISGIEGDAVVSDELSLLIVPLTVENVALFANNDSCHLIS